MTKERVQQLQRLLTESQLDAMIIDSPVNRRYLSGFTGSAGTLFITSSDLILLTDFRYISQASQQAEQFQIVEYVSQPMDDIYQMIQTKGYKRIGFEQEHVSFAQYKKWASICKQAELAPVSGLVEGIRAIKEPEEIAIISEAAELADRTFSHILNFIEPGKTELEIALEMEMYMRSNGATSTSFETIVASGERSALPHGIASSKVIGNNEFVKLDFGAYYKGYCSDITRTVFVGKPSAKHKEIYDIVLEAQLHALEHLKPGMTGVEGDALARDIIDKYGYGDLFGHGTGHGIGMEIHEAPRLSRFSDTILTPGMTVTVEPGIYVPNFGGVRIEDDIVMTETGIQILTSSTKELIILG